MRKRKCDRHGGYHLMTIPCTNWSDCGVISGGCCALGLFGGHPGVGVCLRRCDQYVGPDRAPLIEQLHANLLKATDRPAVQRLKPGAILRHIIHFILDCIEAIPLIRPRARHRLRFIERIKTCGGCVVREKQIDYYCLHWWNTLRRRFVTEAT